ncbi:MAG: GDP-mannose 4,6-dehydratase [Candidatus Omnitrophica bacterium]|nr:GDP-mannose 4,6-dehydratase [Candidatus Omnitrophota bacterium]
MKKALITGITGQDGSYLAEFLLEKGYEIYGIVRRSSSINRERIDHLSQKPATRRRVKLAYGDLNDASSINSIIESVRPDEVYNLAAQSHVKVSFEIPEYTAEVTGLGTLRLLEAIRAAGGNTKFYQASSSELYGRSEEVPQTEKTPFRPVSPYAVAKLFAYWTAVNYRESYNIFACNGILFNHESPRRGETFVTRKITRTLARIKKGLEKELLLGNLDAKRDWGYAKDYVEAMWLMLQQKKADDFVIATGQTRTVRDFLEESFGYVGLDYKKYVKIDKRFFRPIEVNILQGDTSKARKKLGWKPRTSFRELVRLMVDADMELLEREMHGKQI